MSFFGFAGKKAKPKEEVTQEHQQSLNDLNKLKQENIRIKQERDEAIANLKELKERGVYESDRKTDIDERESEALKEENEKSTAENAEYSKILLVGDTEESVAQENMTLVPMLAAPNEADEDVVIDNWTREKLTNKYNILRGHNLILQMRIMELISPSEDTSEFPEIEDIRDKFDTLRKQYSIDVSVHDCIFSVSSLLQCD